MTSSAKDSNALEASEPSNASLQTKGKADASEADRYSERHVSPSPALTNVINIASHIRIYGQLHVALNPVLLSEVFAISSSTEHLVFIRTSRALEVGHILYYCYGWDVTEIDE